jgi:hypothetical protein
MRANLSDGPVAVAEVAEGEGERPLEELVRVVRRRCAQAACSAGIVATSGAGAPSTSASSGGESRSMPSAS